MEDQTNAMNEKVTQAVKDWWRKGGKIPAQPVMTAANHSKLRRHRRGLQTAG